MRWKRLYAAHQVYAAADWKDGHVTARSLARLPTFHAKNLDDLIAGRMGAEALESNASIFDRYLQVIAGGSSRPRRKRADWSSPAAPFIIGPITRERSYMILFTTSSSCREPARIRAFRGITFTGLFTRPAPNPVRGQ